MGFILLLVFSLLLDVSSAVDSHSAALVAVEPEPCETGECHDATSSGKSLDIATEPFADPDALPFVATDKWQEVVEGQAVPPGLHYKIDLQTGQKFAKLLEDDEKTGVQTLSEKRNEKLDLLKPALTRDFTNDTSEQVMVDYTDWVVSHRERKKRLFTSSSVQISEALDAYQSATTPEEQVEVLNDFELILHDLEIAEEFNHQGGTKLIMSILVNDGIPTELRKAAASALGSACSNNPKFQQFAAELGAVEVLVTLASSTKELRTLKSVIFALSALVRGPSQSLSRSRFNIAALEHLLDSPHAIIHDKLLRLIEDLVLTSSEMIDQPAGWEEMIKSQAKLARTEVLAQLSGKPQWCRLAWSKLAEDRPVERLSSDVQIATMLLPSCDPAEKESQLHTLKVLREKFDSANARYPDDGWGSYAANADMLLRSLSEP